MKSDLSPTRRRSFYHRLHPVQNVGPLYAVKLFADADGLTSTARLALADDTGNQGRAMVADYLT